MKQICLSILFLLLVLKGFSSPRDNSDSASYYLKMALQLKAAGRAADADENFQKAIRFNPADEKIRIEYGNFLADQRKYFPAAEQYDKVLTQNATNQDALEKLIDLNYKLNNWNGVIKYGQKLGQNTTVGNLNYMIGKSYYEVENYGQAQTYVEQQLKANPTDAEALRLLGKIYIELNSYNKAIDIYKKALAINPDNSDALYELALLYHTTGNGKEAVNCFEQAIQKGYKQDVSFKENMGLAYLSVDVKKGVDILNGVLEMKPGNTEIIYQIAQAYYRTKQYQQAADNFRKVYNLDPTNAQALYMCGSSYIMGGDRYKGTAICEEAIRKDPSLDKLKNRGLK